MKTLKDIVLDFTEFILATILIIIVIIFFVAGDNFDYFKKILLSFAPIGFWLGVMLIMVRLRRMEIKRRKEEDDADVVVYLSVFDKLLSEIILFSTPIIINVIAWIFKGKVELYDVVASLMIFIIMFLRQKYIFSKER